MLQLCHKYDVANYDWLKKEVGLCKSNVQLQFVDNCGKLCSQGIGEKWAFTPNLQTMPQNVHILKLFCKMPLFLKLDFNKIELCVKLDIFKIELYEYF